MKADDLFRGITRRASMSLAMYYMKGIKEEQMFQWGILELKLRGKIQAIKNPSTEQRIDAFVTANSSNYPTGVQFVLRAKDESDLPDGYVFTYKMSDGSILKPYYFISETALVQLKEKDIGVQE